MFHIRLLLLVATGATAFAARPSMKETVYVPGAQIDSINARIKSDLRNLITAQESYFSDHSAYAAQVEDLKFKASPGVTVRFVLTQNNSWAAVATHESRPGRSCVVAVNVDEKHNPKTARDKRSGGDGEPVCDED